MPKLRYAIAGFGGIAERRIAREAFGLGAGEGPAVAELVAATDADPSRRPAAERLGLAWRDGYEELLALPGLDAVFIATNNASHYGLARRALEAGKHVLVEKPIATALSQARELCALARERSLSLGVDHMMTRNGYNLAARRFVAQGALGRLESICLHMEFAYGYAPAEAASWRCSRPGELGGPIGDVGSHCLYMAEFLAGDEIARLGCVYAPRSLPLAVENGAFIQFATKGGLEGSARVAFNQRRGGLGSAVRSLGYELYGDEGALRCLGGLFQLSGSEEGGPRLRLELERGELVEAIEPELLPNIYRAQVESHAASIAEGRPLDGGEALRNLLLVELCHASAARAGEMLEVPGL